MFRSLKTSTLVLLVTAATALGQQADSHPQTVQVSPNRANVPWVVTVVHTIELQKVLARFKEGQEQNLRIGVPASVPPFVYNIATGIAVDNAGHIVTRLSHLASSERQKEIITVNCADGSTLPAKLVGVDYATGFAVLEVPSLKVSLPDPIQATSLSGGSLVRILSTDISQKQIGNSRNVRLYLSPAFKESQGRILTGKPYSTRGALALLCHDFRLRSDGSVVTDFENHLVGVAQYAGFGRALVFPFDFLRDTVVKRVLEKGADVPAGWLGIKGEAATLPDQQAIAGALENNRGVIVREVVASSPAAASGIRADDIITGVDGLNVVSTVDLAALLSSFPAGTGVTVKALRDRKPTEFKVTLGPKPVDNLALSMQIYSGMESSPAAEIAALKARLEELKSLYRTYIDSSPSTERTETLSELELEVRYVQDALRAVSPGGPGDGSAPKLAQLRGPEIIDANQDSVSPAAPTSSSPEPPPVRRAQIPLGFWVRELNAQLAGPFGARGMLVDSVIHGSPAEQAGLMAGDVIVAVGERTILSLEQLQAALASRNVRFDLQIVRRKQPMSVTIPGVK